MRQLIIATAFLLLLLIPVRALSKTLTIAVIDTGVDRDNSKLCKTGHKSFVDGDPDALDDKVGHGTHVAGTIAINGGNHDYCLVSLKFYGTAQSYSENLISMRKALQYAINIKVDFINISGGGAPFDAEEYRILRRAVKKNITTVVAAGNENTNLDTACTFFPACYDLPLIVVGNLRATINFERSPSSNYGKRVNVWEVGTDVLSSLPHGHMGYMSGTSQAAAVATGKMIRKRFK